MEANKQNQSTTPLYSPNQPKKSNNTKTIAIGALAALLLGSNVYWMSEKGKSDTTITQQATELNESEKLKAEVEKQYYEALSQLEGMRSSNTELNTVIDKQKEELKLQKGKIDNLLKTSKDYARVKQEMSNLQAQLTGYIAENENLKKDNKALTEKVQVITKERDEVAQTAQTLSKQKEGLESEKAELVSTKTKLESEREVLSKKVGIGSVIKVDNVNVTTGRLKSGGKEVERKKAKNVEVVNICFKATANRVTDPGDEQFYVRIITPTGETIAVENQGSGVLKDNVSGEQVRYTTVATLQNYKNEESDVCVKWDAKASPLTPGNYEVQVYNKGYLCGKGSFKLKNNSWL